MDSSIPVVDLQDIDFSYPGGFPVLGSLCFSLYRGERVALLGANGSGKSTLFHLIMGLLSPDRGTVRIFGNERKNGGDFHEVRKRIGLLFQNSDDQLFSPTVAEDIAFGPLNLGKSRVEVHDIVSRTLDILGLEGFEQRVTFKLSGGEKRLVALGTVLAMEPEVLLLDEPVLGLDEEHRERFVDILCGMQTFIVVSHDREFVERVTDVRCRIENGRIF
jgi:cobalt/nickel transport system ATP-binding protein